MIIKEKAKEVKVNDKRLKNTFSVRGGSNGSMRHKDGNHSVQTYRNLYSLKITGIVPLVLL